MIRYVLGFAFNSRMEVCLIQKRKPAWQAGKWNGVGGKIENGEAALTAMMREFKEETGVATQPEHWRYFGAMLGDHWECQLFTGMLPQDSLPITMTEEVVAMFGSDLFARVQQDCLPNVQALISVALCGNSPDSGDEGRGPLTLFDYRGMLTAPVGAGLMYFLPEYVLETWRAA